MTAPTMNDRRIAQRPNFTSCLGVTMPASAMKVMKSGSSKTKPKASSVLVVKSM